LVRDNMREYENWAARQDLSCGVSSDIGYE